MNNEDSKSESKLKQPLWVWIVGLSIAALLNTLGITFGFLKLYGKVFNTSEFLVLSVICHLPYIAGAVIIGLGLDARFLKKTNFVKIKVAKNNFIIKSNMQGMLIAQFLPLIILLSFAEIVGNIGYIPHFWFDIFLYEPIFMLYNIVLIFVGYSLFLIIRKINDLQKFSIILIRFIFLYLYAVGGYFIIFLLLGIVK